MSTGHLENPWDNAVPKGIYRPNAQQLSLSVPPVVHSRLLPGNHEFTPKTPSQDGEVSPSRWTLTARTQQSAMRSAMHSAMTTGSMYSQASWNIDAPVENAIRTDPRRFGIALTSGNLALWEPDNTQNWEPDPAYVEGQIGSWEDDAEDWEPEMDDPLITTPSTGEYLVELSDSPLPSPCPPDSEREPPPALDFPPDKPVAAETDANGWSLHIQKEMSEANSRREQRKSMKKIYSVAQKRSTRVFGKVMSRLSFHHPPPISQEKPSMDDEIKSNKEEIVYSKAAPKPRKQRSSSKPPPLPVHLPEFMLPDPFPVKSKARVQNVEEIVSSRREITSAELQLPAVALSPIYFEFSASTPIKDSPNMASWTNTHSEYASEYDRFQAMERLRKLVTPTRSSTLPTTPSFRQDSLQHSDDYIDNNYAIDKLRKLRASAVASGRPPSMIPGHRRSRSSPATPIWDFQDSQVDSLQAAHTSTPPVPPILQNRSSHNSLSTTEWDFHNYPLQPLRASPTPVPPVPPLPPLYGHRRSRSSPAATDWDFRDSPLQLLQGAPSPIPPVPPIPPSVGQLLRSRSRSRSFSERERPRPYPLDLSHPGASPPRVGHAF